MLWKLFLVLAIVILLVLMVKFANSQPVPRGVDGYIFELDGITEVAKGTDFYVHNLNNDQLTVGKTGHGSSGKYSVSVKGNDGDTIVIRSWTEYNQVNVTLTLNGVMHDVNLILNTSEPEQPNLTAVEEGNGEESSNSNEGSNGESSNNQNNGNGNNLNINSNQNTAQNNNNNNLQSGSAESSVNSNLVVAEPKTMSRRVYRYWEVEPDSEYLNFAVSKDWLDKLGISKDEVILSAHLDKWYDLKTNIIEEDERNVYYKAAVLDSNYFAITVKEGTQVKSIIEPQVSKVEFPFRISGMVFRVGKLKDDYNFVMNFENTVTKKSVETKVTTNGFYAVSIYGDEGDLIRVTNTANGEQYEFKLRNIKNLDFILNIEQDSFASITGNVVGVFTNSIFSVSSFLVLLLTMFVTAIRIKYWKNERGKF